MEGYTMNRRKEDVTTCTRFRSDRFFTEGSQWYYATRENTIEGPFETIGFRENPDQTAILINHRCPGNLVLEKYTDSFIHRHLRADGHQPPGHIIRNLDGLEHNDFPVCNGKPVKGALFPVWMVFSYSKTITEALSVK